MERGNTKHGPRRDDALADQLDGELGPGGSNREEWVSGEPPADDDPPARRDLPVEDGRPTRTDAPLEDADELD